MWLIFGGALILLEFLLPGLVVVFFGLAAVLVGLAAGFGLVDGLGASIALWAAGSAALVFGARQGAKRLGPGEREHGSTDEELQAFGEVVEVVEAVGPDRTGRIRFRGSTWPARTIEESLAPNARARIVTRENLVWIVEKDSKP